MSSLAALFSFDKSGLYDILLNVYAVVIVVRSDHMDFD